MSLINQVLRDLDRRLGSVPQLAGPALASTAAPQGRRARRMAASGVGGVVLLSVVVAVAWPSGARSGAAKVDALPAGTPTTLALALPTEANPALMAAPATGHATANAFAAPTPALAASAAEAAASLRAATTLAPAVSRAGRLPALPYTAPGMAPTIAAGPAASASASTAAWPRRRAARLAPDDTMAWAPAESPRVKVPMVALPQAAAPDAAASGASTPWLPAANELGGPARIEKRASGATRGERADAEYRLGVAAQERGQLVEAAKSYAAALKVDAGLAVARVGHASVLIAQGHSADAEELLRAGLASNPQQANLALPLARLMAARGDLSGAADVMRSGLPGAAGQPEYRAYSGAILQRAGRHAEAAEQFEAALRVAPGNGVWWMGLGISLAAEGRSDAARTAYSQARASGSLSPELLQFVDQRLQQLF